jgi:transposase
LFERTECRDLDDAFVEFAIFCCAGHLTFSMSRYDSSNMNFFNFKRSTGDDKKLIEQLCAENASLRDENAALLETNQTLREQLAVTEMERAQAQAELSTLTDAARVLQDDREKLRSKVSELQTAVNRLTDMVWGQRSEKRPASNQPTLFDLQPNPEELSAKQQEILAAEDLLNDAAKKKLLDELLQRRKTRQKKRLERRGREEFPEHLERRHVTLDLDDEQKKDLVLLDVKVFERLRFEKPSMYVEVINRYVYVRPGEPDAGVVSPPAPLGILPGVKYDFSVIAAALSMKLNFHQPTYRQQDLFAQAGFFPSRSTLNDWFNYSTIVIDPLFAESWRLLLQEGVMLGDDTRVRLLTRDALDDDERDRIRRRRGGKVREGPQPGSVTSYVWLYTGLDGAAPYDIFHWSLTHEDCWIDSHLESFRGVFVGDAAGPNARLHQRSDGRITHAACNSHARREFVAAERNHPLEASKALAFYWLLYDIEVRSKLLDGVDLLEVRRKEAVPVWNAFRLWLESDALKEILPKSPLGKALAYMRNHWDALQRYLHDARLPIDNNQSERTIRPFVIGRRNWTFLGHPKAAPGRLKLFSIASSAHRHGLMVHDYFEDVLRKLAYAQQREPHLLEPGSEYLRALLPDHWARANPALVCHDRLREREAVAESKQIRYLRNQLAKSARRDDKPSPAEVVTAS